ncbi:MAG: CopG family transcriptional regulator [Symploca sp. SIO3C6]|uniref:CopG family transcriptional regulator n=1 Tax=Symploca sp. SIO1C4 TaxID=2607765 RepID=A0A6B3NJG3_9CYAN|nr:CopG family transcriptional regulator [Symploca sp. SIO3C6]NER31767.1 CopG family transcriptional regulator [Symploca sp. SIO1C4]
MPRKVSTEPLKQLLVELPLSEYQALEEYCLERQETKRQVIR